MPFYGGGHGETEDERVPRLVEAMAGKTAIGADAGTRHTAVWTNTGGIFAFGIAGQMNLGPDAA